MALLGAEEEEPLLALFLPLPELLPLDTGGRAAVAAVPPGLTVLNCS